MIIIFIYILQNTMSYYCLKSIGFVKVCFSYYSLSLVVPGGRARSEFPAYASHPHMAVFLSITLTNLKPVIYYVIIITCLFVWCRKRGSTDVSYTPISPLLSLHHSTLYILHCSSLFPVSYLGTADWEICPQVSCQDSLKNFRSNTSKQLIYKLPVLDFNFLDENANP